MKKILKKTGLILLTLLILATQADARSYGSIHKASSPKSTSYSSGLITAGAIGIGAAATINNSIIGTNLNRIVNDLNEKNNQIYNQRIYDSKLREQVELESKKEYLEGNIWKSLDEKLTKKLKREFERTVDKDETHLGRNNPAYLNTDGLDSGKTETQLRLYGNFYATVYTGKMPANLYDGEYMRNLTENTKFVLKERVRLLNEKQQLLYKGKDTSSINNEIKNIEYKVKLAKNEQDKILIDTKKEQDKRIREWSIEKERLDKIHNKETIDFLNKSQTNLDSLGIVYRFTVRHPKWMGDMDDFFLRNPGTEKIFNENKERFLSKEFRREAFRITFNYYMELSEYKNPAFKLDKYRVQTNNKIKNEYRNKLNKINNSRQNIIFKWWDKKMAELDYNKVKPLPHINDGVKIKYTEKTCVKILKGYKTGRFGLTRGGFIMDGKDYYQISFNDRFDVQRLLKVGDRIEKVNISNCNK